VYIEGPEVVPSDWWTKWSCKYNSV